MALKYTQHSFGFCRTNKSAKSLRCADVQWNTTYFMVIGIILWTKTFSPPCINSNFILRICLHLSSEMWFPAGTDIPTLAFFKSSSLKNSGVVGVAQAVSQASCLRTFLEGPGGYECWRLAWAATHGYTANFSMLPQTELAWAHLPKLGITPPNSNADMALYS